MSAREREQKRQSESACITRSVYVRPRTFSGETPAERKQKHIFTVAVLIITCMLHAIFVTGDGNGTKTLFIKLVFELFRLLLNLLTLFFFCVGSQCRNHSSNAQH